MRRAALIVTAASLLACAGLTPKLTARALSPLTIDTLDGTVTESTDYGLRGDLTTSRLGVTQALSWGAIDPESAVEDEARQLWDGTRAVVAGESEVSLAEQPDLQAVTVDGQPGFTFTIELGAEELLGTTWACPDAGVRVSLTTGGRASVVASLHEQALASARCGHDAVALDPAAITWTFTGPTDRWRPQPSDDLDGGRWERDDGHVIAVVQTDGALAGDPDVPNLCGSVMRQIHDNLRDTYTMDESKATWVDRPDGCSHEWAGTTANGALVRGRFDHQVCGPERGYTLTCLVFDEGEPLRGACAGLVACR